MLQLSAPLILASASPRRSFLLKEMGLEFTVVSSDVSEHFPDTMPADMIPIYLAERKAAATMHLLAPDVRHHSIILAADSIVVKDDYVYNKPANAEQAQEMLTALADGMHRVITGVCLKKNAFLTTSFAVVTEVTFDEITEAEMEYYITACQPFDKAGSYGIQEWIGYCKVSSIKGSYTNIMGLPTREVYQALQRWAVV